MKCKRWMMIIPALCAGTAMVRAQATNAVEPLQQQLQRMQEQFERQERETRNSFQQMIRDQQKQIEALKLQVANGITNTAGPTAPGNAPPSVSAAQLEDLNQRLEELTVASKKTFVSQFNPGIGFVGDTIFSYTDKGNNLTGFSDRSGGFDVFLRSAELNLEATVDPFARAYAVITGSADAQSGEATMGVEEAAIITTSLPWNLTVQGGRFFADFGRFGHIHDHELPFVWRPLVLDRYIGGESRTDGAQMNYLLPTRQYVSLTLGLGDQFGESLNGAGSFRPLSEMNYWGHLSTYFDLSPNLSLETGVSGLANPTAHGLGDVVEQQARFLPAGRTDRRH